MNDGDFVEIEFVGRVKDTGEIFDLTDADLAKKEGIFEKDHKYGPALVIIGSKSIVPGVEDQVKAMKPGEEREFDLGPEKGFGKRDPKFVQIVSLGKFYEQKINPVPGAFVNMDGRNCKIQSVSGGRVRVDFNHPLAGKDLVYKVKVLKEVKAVQDKVDSVIKYLGIEAEAKLEGESVKIKMKKTNQVLEKIVDQMMKKWVKEIKTITFEAEKEPPKKEAGDIPKKENEANKEEHGHKHA